MPAVNDVRPFEAIHYNADKIEEIGRCLSQPYDIISPEQQSAYYEQHEFNVVRLILNRKRPGDNEKSNCYTRARDHLLDWKKRGILTTEARQSFWIYEQEYETPTGTRSRVKGFIGVVRLHDYKEGCIVPHEKVMKDPIEDRMKLTRITQTQLESIWGFYRDPSTEIDTVLEDVCRENPSLDYMETPIIEPEAPVRHRLWECQNRNHCDTIQRRMGKLKIYIADGHHRYHTMLALRDEIHKKRGLNNSGLWEYVLMWLVNASSNDITILPYHRMVHGLSPSQCKNLLGYFDPYFTIDSYPASRNNGDDKQLLQGQWLRDLRKRGEKSHSFGVVLAGESCCYTISLKDTDSYLKDIFSGGSSQRKTPSDAWKLLDVNILNNLVLHGGLGITEPQLSDQTNVTYTHSASEAVERVRNGEMQIAFLLNPMKLDEVVMLSLNGEVLPHKSTFFCPKPVSGLVFYPMGDTTP
jgi:uncharacterized protein (DUF1015 family)